MNLSIEEVNEINKPFRALITSTNLNKLYFKVVKTSNLELRKIYRTEYGEKLYNKLLSLPVVKSFVLLVWRPSELLDPSFQLTFVSVAAIVAIAYPLIGHLRSIGNWSPSAATPFPPNVPNWLRRFCETICWNKAKWSVESKRQIWSANIFKSPYFAGRIGDTMRNIFRYVFEGLLISLIVQICMLPLSVVYFHRVSVASILLNLWVSVFIAVESFAPVIGALVGHISTLLATPFFAVAEVMNWLMLSVPNCFR